jgi:hypothetical protein
LSLEYHTGQGPQDIKNIKECVDIFARRQKYEVNLTGQEGAVFLSARWLTIEEFKESLPDCARGGEANLCAESPQAGMREIIPSAVLFRIAKPFHYHRQRMKRRHRRHKPAASIEQRRCVLDDTLRIVNQLSIFDINMPSNLSPRSWRSRAFHALG